jgi:hypothetical protein
MDETEVGLRLQELLDLYSRGAISEQEYVQARARVLAGAPTDVHWVDSRPPTLPVVYGPPPGGEPASGHRTRSVVIVVSAAVLFVALVAGGLVWLRWHGSSGAAQEAARTAPVGKKLDEGASAAPAGGQTTESRLRPDTALAQCVSQPSQDAGGHPTSYEPALVLDGHADTAWRCDGDGVGQTLEIRFGQAVDVDRVGLIPGFAKTDSSDGTDRYAQDRRIAAVQYTFDDGSTAVQRFDTDPGDRSLQTMPVPRVRTARIDITILESVPGTPINGQPAVDKVAVSEVTFAGSAG